jgi:hypothetical protein
MMSTSINYNEGYHKIVKLSKFDIENSKEYGGDFLDVDRLIAIK